jgi:uncharacterized protein
LIYTNISAGIIKINSGEEQMVKREIIEKAVEIGSRLKRAMIATADYDGLPHMAASGKITAETDEGIGISEWFCPGTLANLQANPRVSIVVWDSDQDSGYQILGNSEGIEDLSVMNGFSPGLEKGAPVPQVERKIHVRVKKIIHFSQAPHSDMEE